MSPPPPESAPPSADAPAEEDSPAQAPAETAPQAAAATPRKTKDTLLEVWSEAFGKPVEGGDGFIKLGGDELMATAIAGRVQELFGVELDLRVFATDVTATALAVLVDQRQAGGTGDGLPPLRRTRRMSPLSTAQERVWRPRTFAQNPTASHSAMFFLIRGPLDVAVLRRAIEEMVRRHEILRTTFIEYGDQPAAVVRATMPLEFEVDELRETDDREARATQILHEEQQRPLDVEQGPLHRWRLLRMGGAEFRLLWSTHDLIRDPLMPRIFFRELATIYTTLHAGREPEQSGPRPLQYTDYAVWERAAVGPGSRAYRAELDWWRRQFESPVPPLQLPFARTTPAGPATEPLSGDGAINWGTERPTAAKLDRVGRTAGATFQMTRLAAVSALIALESGARDFVVGMPVSTRTRPQLQTMLGRFMNVSLLRVRFAGDPSFNRWLGEIRRAMIETGTHTLIPAERVRRELDAALPPAGVRFVSWPGIAPMEFGGVKLEPMGRAGERSAVFGIAINQAYESERCWAEFDPSAHDRAGVEQFVNRLQALIAAAAAEPGRSLRDLHAAIAVL